MSIYPNQSDLETFIHDVNHERIILERHANASRMMHAMVAGDEDAVRYYLNITSESINEVNRIYTPEEATCRQMRNRLLSLNITFSFCANAANVHPLYLHSIIRRFDKKIEQVNTAAQEAAMQDEMVKSYCTMIRHTYTEHYGDFSDSVIRQLLTSLSSPPSLEELAKEMQVVPATISRRFKAETGQTIPEFVNRSRIRLAQLYMQEAACNLSDIAHSVGFSDASYFSKIFLRYAGVTPTEYIKNIHAQTSIWRSIK